MKGWISLSESLEWDVLLTTFEFFKTEPDSFFNAILDHYHIPQEEFSKKKLSEKPGAYFLRKGALTEWRDRCCQRQIDKMNELIPDDWYERFNWPRH